MDVDRRPLVSVVLPTYNEGENIPAIIPRISSVLIGAGISYEVIVVDDDSPDNTGEIADQLQGHFPVRVLSRRGRKGLASAVIEGFAMAKGAICVVMDADLSHPVEKLPDMIRPIVENKCDATVGSRYIKGGGSTDWPLVRKITSRGARLLAKGITSLSDPTSGFMAIRKNALEGVKLSPVGWKIVLEIVAKTNCRTLDVPISFSDRLRGNSKLGLGVQKDYLVHLCRLYAFRYPWVQEFCRFCMVGLSGLAVDTIVLVAFVEIVLLDPRLAAIFAFSVAVTWNYLWNRSWTFDSGRARGVVKSYIFFVATCFLGLGTRLGIMHLLIEYAGMGAGFRYVIASFIGIGSATILNFAGSKWVAFSHKMAS